MDQITPQLMAGTQQMAQPTMAIPQQAVMPQANSMAPLGGNPMGQAFTPPQMPQWPPMVPQLQPNETPFNRTMPPGMQPMNPMMQDGMRGGMRRGPMFSQMWERFQQNPMYQNIFNQFPNQPMPYGMFGGMMSPFSRPRGGADYERDQYGNPVAAPVIGDWRRDMPVLMERYGMM